MSDSEEEFASADEGEETNGTAAPKLEPTNEPIKEALKQEEPAQASSGKKNKKKGKGGKGGGGKHVKGDNAETQQTQQQQQQQSQPQNQATQSSKGKKGKQKDKKEKTKPALSQDHNTQSVEEDQSVSVNELTEATVCEENCSSVKSTVEEAEKSSNDNTNDKENVSESQEKTKLEESFPDTGKETTNIKTAEYIEPTPDQAIERSTEELQTPTKGDDKEGKTLSVAEKASLLKSPSSQSISRPEPDHSQKEEEVLNKLASAATEKKKSSWGWGWGSSILEAASTSVTTFTSQVGEGFSTVLETVESTLNVPSPEELVRDKKLQEEKLQQQASSEVLTDGDSQEATGGEEERKENVDTKVNTADTESEVSKVEAQPPVDTESSEASGTQQSVKGSSDSWFSSWGVSSMAKMVESTSKNIVTGSLDALETLGKKTFDVITERDPGLKKTRGFLLDRGDKPNLSDMLRDAKEHNEAMVKQEKENEEARKAHFGSLFDEFQGLAHLEALEILSNQSEKKVNSLLTALPAETLSSLKPQLMEIKQIFELIENEEEDAEIEEHDFVTLVTDLLKKMNIGASPHKMIKAQEKIRDSLKELEQELESGDTKEPKLIHQSSIQCLAELTSKSIELFHKSGEMILLQLSQQPSLVTTSQHLHSLTKTLCTEVGIISNKFTETLNKCAETNETIDVGTLVTNVYLEASNSSSYIQDGFQLLLPVLQQATIEKSQDPAP